MPLTFRHLAPFMKRVPYRHADAVRAALGAGDVLLDVGGGTGRAATRVGASFRRVVVADVERAMLAHARAAGLAVVIADAGRLPFRAGAADAVLVVDALHHFPDGEAATREAARVLRPGGRCVVQDFNVLRLKGRAVRALEWILRLGSRFRAPDELRRLLDAAGFTVDARELPGGEILLRGERR